VVSNPYHAASAPSATLVAAPDDQVPSQTGYFYDGAGRVTRQVSYSLASETRETDTTYGGNYTTVTPPSGGTAQTTYTDGNGQDSYIYQYHSAAPPAAPPAPGSGPKAGASGWDQTAYTYTPAQLAATVMDTAGNTWSYAYDLNGDQVAATDPDTGPTTSTFDPNGNLLSATDARGKSLAYAYDADGRKIAEYDTTGGAGKSASDQVAAWTYDTLAKGELTSSIAYVGGTTGTSYTQGVTGYNTFGLPKGTETIVSAGPLSGTYKQLDAYTNEGDLESEYQDQAVGGLPLETVEIGHDTVNQQVAVGSSLWGYVSQAAYTELGQPQQYAMGPNAQPAWLTYTYNQETGQLASSQLQAGTSPVTLDNTTYAYNPAGTIASETDMQSGGQAQVQCFSYDYLGRLSQAWAQGSTGCAPAMSQSAEAGAAAPYWDQYSYDTSGDLTGVTATPASGAATTTTSTFPAAGSPQAHALTAQKSAGPAGTATTSYGYSAAGQTTSIAGPSSAQSLSWNDLGQLGSDTVTGTGAGSTGYVYDAGGNLLLQSDPASITLYLPDEQVVYDTATKAISATRFYEINGQVIAARNGSGQVSYLDTSQQGTASVAVDSEALTATYRFYDPFGNQIGPAPSSWLGTRGFVGGTADPATGLTNLGAREYNPATGSFISPDPLLTPDQPQDLNAYAYAQDDPASQSDPSGQMVPGQSYRVNPGPGSVPTPGQGTANQPASQPGFTARAADSCGIMCSHLVQLLDLLDPVTTPVRTHRVRQVSTGITQSLGPDCNGLTFKYGACPSERGAAGTTPQQVKASAIGAAIIIGGGILDPLLDAALGIGAAAEDSGAADAAAACGGMSFTPATKVLLASGIAVPIASLKPGENALATNIRTRRTQAEPVTAVLVHHDTNRYDLTIRTAHGTAVVHTTTTHLFWDPYLDKWVTANRLSKGEHLQTPGGTTAVAEGGAIPKVHNGWMWDLAVPGNNAHDFYVQAGSASVLVHNCQTFPNSTMIPKCCKESCRRPLTRRLHRSLQGPRVSAMR
jgi:RHS repeat-associated protein